MATKIWDKDSDVESVTTVDGNVKVNTDPAFFGEDALWGDNFGEVLDLIHWAEGNLGGTTPNVSHSVTETGGKLTIAANENAAATSAWGAQSILTFPGNFDREIELDITHGAGANSAIFRMRKDGSDNNNRFYIFKYKSGATERIWASSIVGGVLLSNIFATTNDTPKFKLVRAGTTLQCWYDIGGGWIKLHERVGNIGTLKLEIFVQVNNSSSTCDFNNLIANSGFPVWDDSPELVGDPVILAGTDVTCDMSTFVVNTTGTGSVKCKYKQSGGWSGTWLTVAEMQALGSISISQVKYQLNSNGQQAIKITSAELEYSIGAFDLISQGLGRSSPLLEGGLLH